jgi:hypothetical protein
MTSGRTCILYLTTSVLCYIFTLLPIVSDIIFCFTCSKTYLSLHFYIFMSFFSYICSWKIQWRDFTLRLYKIKEMLIVWNTVECSNWLFEQDNSSFLSVTFWYLDFRADHNLQDVRAKIFPFKRKKVNAEEAESPNTLPAKRKERSISSLVVNTPRITPAGSTGRRTRAVTRKAAELRGLGPIIVDPLKKDNDKSNKQTDNSSLLSSLGKVPQTRRQVNKYLCVLKSHPITCVSFGACNELMEECTHREHSFDIYICRYCQMETHQVIPLVKIIQVMIRT